MAGIDPATFEIEFIERTQSIVKEYTGPYEFSLLVNCLLSLVVLTCERLKQTPSPLFSIMAQDFPELKTTLLDPQSSFEPVNRQGDPVSKTLDNFLKRMRNSIAHGKVFPFSTTVPSGVETWTEVRFVAQSAYAPGRPIELQIQFKYPKLRDFAIEISTLYQRAFLNV